MQNDGAHGADAADADHLDRDVLELEAIEEHPAIFLNRLAILAESRLGPCQQVLDGLVPRVVDERRIVLDHGLMTGHRRKLGEVVFHHAARAGFGERFWLRWRASLSLIISPSCSMSMLAYHTSRTRISLYSAMCSRYDRTHASVASRRNVFAEAVAAAGQDEARGQPFDVPFPRGREGLVQVVDVEDDPPFRRREGAEIHQVAVAARLHAHAGRRGAGQVGGHVERRPAIERERRPQHASVANGDQLGNAAFVGGLHELHRIATVRGRLPLCVGTARAGLPQLLALREVFRPRRTGPDAQFALFRCLILVLP